jgi:diacylglycerol kinase (ATP)
MNFVVKEIKRLNNATRYSMQGFRHAWEGEAAFRLELIVAMVLLPTALLLEVTVLERVALVGCVVLILIVELLNSAVEAAIDRVSMEHHPLSGRGKDLGSAAVFAALVFCAFTWVSILFL